MKPLIEKTKGVLPTHELNARRRRKQDVLPQVPGVTTHIPVRNAPCQSGQQSGLLSRARQTSAADVK